jgi:hypothetical protein
MDFMSSSHHPHPPSKKATGETERSWRVRASRESHDCENPVRSFKEVLEKRDKSQELIKVSIGERKRERVCVCVLVM